MKGKTICWYWECTQQQSGSIWQSKSIIIWFCLALLEVRRLQLKKDFFFYQFFTNFKYFKMYLTSRLVTRIPKRMASTRVNSSDPESTVLRDPVRQVFISQSNDVFTNLALEDWLYRNHDFDHKVCLFFYLWYFLFKHEKVSNNALKLY